MCTTCWTQGINQAAAAGGSSSVAVAMIAAGLSNVGLRGLADRLVASRFGSVAARMMKVGAALVAVAIVVGAILVVQPYSST